MTPKRWSLANRITIWFAVTTATMVFSIIGLSAWFVHSSFQREIAGLAREELEEMQAFFSNTDGSAEAFREISKELQGEHPSNKLAWLVWNADGTEWGRFGDLELLEIDAQPRRELDLSLDLSNGLHWYTDTLDQTKNMGVMLDDTAQVALMKRYWTNALVFALFASLLSTGVGSLIGRKVANDLSRVADGARAIHTPTQDAILSVQDAPEEIRDVADALSEMLRNIRAEHDRVQLMTAGLAHELRSPIQNLLGETEVILLKERDSSEYRQVLESHLEELRDFGRVVDNLVTLCSKSARPAELESFDIGDETRFRLERERTRAQRHNVNVEFESHGDLMFHGDREAVLLAISNLVGNAVQWSPDGEHVTVVIDGTNGLVRITVDDAGPGVDLDLREKIFEPFFRGRAARRGNRIGYGLGLALTRRAVEAHGGTVTVLDSPAGGARFLISLPRRASA